eukprot:scaffold3305_cov328-Pinguiococcus_pyrenoidosus.AAC.4
MAPFGPRLCPLSASSAVSCASKTHVPRISGSLGRRGPCRRPRSARRARKKRSSGPGRAD